MDERTFLVRQTLLQEFKYLPLFYMIPEEIAVKRKLDVYPRDPMAFATNEHWRNEYDSKYFQVMLQDTIALLMWQTFGINSSFDSFSKNYPFVRIAVNTSLWADLASAFGINTNLLASIPGEVPFINTQQALRNCEQFAKVFWNTPKFKVTEIKEIVDSYPSHDDYSKNYSNIKIDFYQSYYHTRNKWGRSVRLIEESDDTILYGYIPNEFAEAEHRMWLDVFLKRLNAKDGEIVKLLNDGYTQVEIAEILGYSNHSGVCKRIKYIRREMTKFKQEEREELSRL